MASIFDSASFIWDGRLAAGASGKLFPLKPNVKDLTGDFLTVARAGTKWVLGSNGLLTEVQANLPAFEFNADGTYKGLLVEPAATNLLTYSQEFDNAAWTKTALTVTANTTVAPDGTTSADTATSTSTTSELYYGSSTAVTTAICSLFVKKSTHKYFGISINGTNNFDSRYQGVFDLDLGTVFQENNSSTPLTNRVSKIENYGNGWFRISVSATFATSANGFVVFQQSNNVPSIPSDNLAWNNSSNGSTFIWGAQLETGSVATSYIPTTGSTANRAADNISLSSASSLIGQTQGRIKVKIDIDDRTSALFRNIVYLYTTNEGNSITLRLNTDNSLQYFVIAGGVLQANIFTGANQTGVLDIDASYGVDNFSLTVNGVSIGTDTSGTVPATNTIALGCNERAERQLNAWMQYLALFPTPA